MPTGLIVRCAAITGIRVVGGATRIGMMLSRQFLEPIGFSNSPLHLVLHERFHRGAKRRCFMCGEKQSLHLVCKKLAGQLNTTLAAKGLLDELENELEAVSWLRTETAPPPGVGRYLVCYPVRGESEGCWIHVDILYRPMVIDGTERLGVQFHETILMAKTFTGFGDAAEIAAIINQRLDESEAMVIEVLDALDP